MPSIDEVDLERARNGAAWLDENVRGWRRKIKRRRLNMDLGYLDPDEPDKCGCILAQLRPGAHYCDTADSLGVPSMRSLGLNGATSTAAWLQVLREGPS